MKNKENQERESGKKIKQQITVPFLWEEKPGAPKKDWRPKHEPLTPVPLAVKYVASVPFKWEEKPGTPLRCFAQEATKPMTQDTMPEKRSLPLPPAYFTKYEYEFDGGESSKTDEYDDQDLMSDLDFEELSIQSKESFCSAPSPLANRLTPLHNPFIIHQNDGYVEDPFSPGSTKSPRNNATGDSFLDSLFPLHPPKSSFLQEAGNSKEKVGYPENQPSTLAECSGIRRPLTLGELIMRSRRRDCRRKAVHMKKQNQRKDFKMNKDEPRRCFNFGASDGRLAKLFRKSLLTLKLS